MIAPGTRARDRVQTDEALVRLDRVSLRLGSGSQGRQILSDVSLSIGPGEFTGLIGPNGAGKTTLLRVILGLLPASEGTVARQTDIGYVPQKLAIDPDVPLRAKDVVALGVDGTRLGIPLPGRHKDRARRAEEMLEAVGALSYKNARIGELSGGEQQRVMIAHALISKPRLLLLDEPLANLDISSARSIVQLLDGLSRNENIAVLLSAHDMNPLLTAMDTIIYVARGHVAVGPADDVVRSEVLTSLYGFPVEVIRTQGRVLVIAGEE